MVGDFTKMNRRQRHIYYDTDLQIEMYEFKGIGQKFVSHFHGSYGKGQQEFCLRRAKICDCRRGYSAD